VARDKPKQNGYKPPPEPFSLETPEINPDDFELPRRNKRERTLPVIETEDYHLPERDSAYTDVAPRNQNDRRPRGDTGRLPEMEMRRARDIYPPRQRPPRQNRRNGARRNNRKRGFQPTGLRLSPTAMRVVTGGIIFVAVVVVAVMFISRLTTDNALAVFLGDNFVGYIHINERDSEEGSFHDDAVLQLSFELGANVLVDEIVTVHPTRASSGNITPRVVMLNELRDRFTYRIEAVEIWVNGVREAFLRSMQDKLQVELMLTDAFRTSQTREWEVLGWDIVQVSVIPEDEHFDQPLDAFHRLSRPIESTRPYTVQQGDSLERIAREFRTTADRIVLDNDGVYHDTLIFPGDVLQIFASVPLLDVRTIDEFEDHQIIEMTVEERPNSSLPQSHVRTLVEGRNGEMVVTIRQVRVNNVIDEDETVVIPGLILTESITHVVEVGTGS